MRTRNHLVARHNLKVVFLTVGFQVMSILMLLCHQKQAVYKV